MTNSKYSNDEVWRQAIKASFYGIEDEDLPMRMAIDNIVTLLEQTSINTLKAAIEALPKFKDMKAANADQMEGWRDCAVLSEANLKALIGGDK